MKSLCDKTCRLVGGLTLSTFVTAVCHSRNIQLACGFCFIDIQGRSKLDQPFRTKIHKIHLLILTNGYDNI